MKDRCSYRNYYGIPAFDHRFFFNARNNIKWDVDFTRPVLEWDLKAEIVVTAY